MQDFFQKNNKKGRALFREIERASDGLVYISETDAPVQAFSGRPTDTLTREIILEQTKGKAGDPVEEVSFDAFFDRLTAIKDWFGARERARAEKFLSLQKLLKENLREPKVFRIGKIQIDIYAVGIDKDGYLMGVKTKAVET